MESTQLWTRILTEADSPFVVSENFGFSKFSVVCQTTTPITIQGNGRVGSYDSQPIPLNEKESFGWEEGVPCEDWVIIIPLGATCKCIAVK